MTPQIDYILDKRKIYLFIIYCHEYIIFDWLEMHLNKVLFDFQDLIPHYQALKVKIPYLCPFYKDRDRYIANEERKDRESSSKWACGYCGKAFIGELYVDKHFTRRHAETIYKVWLQVY